MPESLRWGQDGPGVLLVHGFTGSPGDLSAFGEGLAADGYRVLAPWLAGHGGDPRDLARATAHAWRRSAEMGLLQLVEESPGSGAAVLGLSLGGMLAVDLAARFPVRALVLVNPAAGVRRRAAAIAPYMWRLVPYIKIGPGAEDRLSVHAVAELLRATREAVGEAPKVRAPSLVLQSQHDPTVRPEATRLLFERIGSREKEFDMLASHEHVPQHDAAQFVQRTAEFLRRTLGGAS